MEIPVNIIDFEILDIEPSNDLTQISFGFFEVISVRTKECGGHLRARINYERSIIDSKLYELIVCSDCGKLLSSRPC